MVEECLNGGSWAESKFLDYCSDQLESSERVEGNKLLPEVHRKRELEVEVDCCGVGDNADDLEENCGTNAENWRDNFDDSKEEEKDGNGNAIVEVQQKVKYKDYPFGDDNLDEMVDLKVMDRDCVLLYDLIAVNGGHD